MKNTMKKEMLASLFSQIMEEPVSVRQSWCILHVAVVLLLLVFTSGLPVLLHFAMCGWLLYALWECKRAGLR